MNIDNMSISQLEKKVKELYNKKMNIVRKHERGILSTFDAETKYAEVNKLYSKCYIKLEKMRSEAYDNFISGFKIGDK